MSQEIIILASDFSKEFENFSCTTTHRDVKEGIDFFKNKKQKELEELLGKIGRNLLKYNKTQLTKEYENKTEEFNNWTSDLMLFYCCRFVLYNKPIPISKS
jgi:hypothetical protein